MTELTQEDLQLIRNWRIFQDKITCFQNKANLSLFQEIYDEKEGLRLIQYFVNDCKKDFSVFCTYLTREQYNKTLQYILKLEK